MKFFNLVFLCLSVAFFTSCDNNVLDPEPVVVDPTGDSLKFKGTGTLNFNSYAPFASKKIKLHYHIPQNATTQTPILIAMHGAERDGIKTRAAFIANANSMGFIVVAPELSEADFPGGDGFNLGNVFVDGDNPSPSSLNDEADWTFSVIDPIFQFMKNLIQSKVENYDLFGHSAGGQFVHRFAMHKPNTKVNRIVSAASGWYMVPDKQVVFPYGLKSSPAENMDLSALFSRELHVVIGEADNDPDYPGLRHNTFADAQGDDRYERAQYFYSRCETIAQEASVSYNWKYLSLPKVGHDITATANAAAIILYKK